MKMFLEKKRRWLILPLDCAIVSLAFYLSWVLRFDQFDPQKWAAFPGWNVYLLLLLLQIISTSCSFIFVGIYKNLWAYASLHDMYKILKAVLLAAFISMTAMWLYNRMENLPRSIIIIEYILIFLFLSFRSFSWRLLRELWLFHQKKKGKLTLLIGTGMTANQLARELREDQMEYLPVAFLDPEKKCINAHIQGLPVLGGLEKLSEVICSYHIEQVILTKQLKSSQARFVYHTCESNGIKAMTITPISQSIKAKKNSIKTIREIELEDLLSREPVELEMGNIQNVIQNQTILITGAGGSIGSELCRQLIRCQPACLILLDLSESALYDIDYELHYSNLLSSSTRIASFIGDIRDKAVLEKMFNENDIQIVFHCAAYKHVPLLEFNVEQAILNNLIGTINLAQISKDKAIERFIMLSTDKAVNPVNIMGATKRIAELYIQSLGHASDSSFLAVRFGNVMGSKGSVIPLFSKQIEAGSAITVTHPEMTRYFMTIPEAVDLVIQASVMGANGRIYILDMGEAVKIKDLAEDMIRFAGLIPHKDIQIEYIGLRPGEKLFEELVSKNETRETTEHKKIFVAKGYTISLGTLNKKIETLVEELYQNDRHKIDLAIASIIPEYRPGYQPLPIAEEKPIAIS